MFRPGSLRCYFVGAADDCLEVSIWALEGQVAMRTAIADAKRLAQSDVAGWIFGDETLIRLRSMSIYYGGLLQADVRRSGQGSSEVILQLAHGEQRSPVGCLTVNNDRRSTVEQLEGLDIAISGGNKRRRISL